ncbi:hypothetical protein F7734_10030 [Scytonema sp. UIC 10036]|uniref:Uma2 family endonuclease n=1 Tax=Scytonema sp. UIC 10036 TaxID=2304196 RepID=UPI0012DA5074|nr:Uma2 family endonuclease [Scytonema sp. UIC 10036]MUG92769.1 hypothetical protein [Scytonema sp. UIC 10036]
MSDQQKQSKFPPTQQGLEYHCASQSIELSECSEPEFRLELVEGKFLVGGTIEGSRWLLKEALIGWGLEAAVAFAPLQKWWEALKVAYEVPHTLPDEWLTWAEDLPLSPDYQDRWYPPLGSRFKGEHRWVLDDLRQGLSTAISQAGLGKCFGPNYGMQLGNHVFTPDILMCTTSRLAENTCHDCYMEGAADLVVEIVLPEQALLYEQVVKQYYEQGNVLHYWVVNPVSKQFQFWRWSPQGYQLQSLDSDGCYRGVSGLTFNPELFRSKEQGLPAFSSIWQPRRWEMRYEQGEELGWGSLELTPIVEKQPHAIQPEQFIAWCPETKLESGPLIGGGEIGTRNAIAMLLMSLGLVETVKLMPGYEWVRILRRIERQQQQDARLKQEWWQYAQTLAQQLQSEYQVGGVGIIGDLIKDLPLNFWSEIHLVLWEVPEQFKKWRFLQGLPDNPRICLTEVERATPAQWQALCENMTVLVGQWQGIEQPRRRKKLQFYWLSD